MKLLSQLSFQKLEIPCRFILIWVDGKKMINYFSVFCSFYVEKKIIIKMTIVLLNISYTYSFRTRISRSLLLEFHISATVYFIFIFVFP